jgi:hypothetical protein
MARDDDHAPATNDAYTGMLSISLLALIGGCVLLFLDYSQYPDSKPPTLTPRPPGVKLDGPPIPQPPAGDGPKADGPKADGPKGDGPKADGPKDDKKDGDGGKKDEK